MKHFQGDGRETMQPTCQLPGCQSIPVSRSAANLLVDQFCFHNRSNHSAAGGTLWVILQFCSDTKWPYTLTAVPDYGYEVTHNLLKGPAT